jgi:ADP-ribosylglycohydrolase
MIADQLQQKATDAGAAALWALVAHWDSPEDAVVAAVHQGGYCHTVGALAGGLAGALHGGTWLPLRWWDGLAEEEEGKGGADGDGRSAAVALGRQLAELDCGGGGGA